MKYRICRFKTLFLMVIFYAQIISKYPQFSHFLIFRTLTVMWIFLYIYIYSISSPSKWVSLGKFATSRLELVPYNRPRLCSREFARLKMYRLWEIVYIVVGKKRGGLKEFKNRYIVMIKGRFKRYFENY